MNMQDVEYQKKKKIERVKTWWSLDFKTSYKATAIKTV